MRSILIVISYKKVIEVAYRYGYEEAGLAGGDAAKSLNCGEARISVRRFSLISIALQCDIANIMEVVLDGNPASEEQI